MFLDKIVLNPQVLKSVLDDIICAELFLPQSLIWHSERSNETFIPPSNPNCRCVT